MYLLQDAALSSQVTPSRPINQTKPTLLMLDIATYHIDYVSICLRKQKKSSNPQPLRFFAMNHTGLSAYALCGWHEAHKTVRLV